MCALLWKPQSSKAGYKNLVEHGINTRNSTPIMQPPRTIPFTKQEESFSIIIEVLEEDVMEESSSLWLSLVV